MAVFLTQLNNSLIDGTMFSVGINGLFPKLLFALAGCLMLLRQCDRRLAAVGPSVLVAVATLVASIPVLLRSSGVIAYALLGVGVAATAVLAIILIHRWSRLTPAALQAEAGSEVAQSKKAMRAQRRGIATQETKPASRLESILLAVGLMVFGLAALLPLSAGGVDGPGTLSSVGLDLQRQWLPRLYGFTVVGLWSVTLFYVIELTWLCSPDSFDREQPNPVKWAWSMSVATVLFCLALITCLAIFLRSSEIGIREDLAERVFPIVFALTWLIVSFIAWMIPARVSRFRRDEKADGWTSLTLAGWLACCCLAVLCALPSDWPWRLF